MSKKDRLEKQAADVEPAAGVPEDLMKDTENAASSPSPASTPSLPPPTSGSGESSDFRRQVQAEQAREMTAAERFEQQEHDNKISIHKRIYDLEARAKGHGLEPDRDLMRDTATFLRDAIGLEPGDDLLYPPPSRPSSAMDESGSDR